MKREQNIWYHLAEYSLPNKDAGSNIAIEMTSLWHKTPLLHSYAEFLTGQWASRLNSQREKWERRGKKGLIGLPEERRRTFRVRSQALNQQNSFNIPNPGGVEVLQEWRREARWGEMSAWDMMRLGLREGGEKRRDELLMAQQVWRPLGNTGAWEEGQSPPHRGQREGESVCTYIYVCVCGWGGLCPPCLLQYHPQRQSPLIAAVNVTAANRNVCRPMRTQSLPMWTN